jgi:CheY-like chemotaxis protein
MLGSGKSVLLVDDSANMRALLYAFVRSLGFNRIVEAESAEAAERCLEAERFDLILVDWALPMLDGLDLIRRIRDMAEAGQGDVPIVLVTGHTEYGRIVAARDSGADAVIAKPLSHRTFEKVLAQVLSGSRRFVRAGTYKGPDRRRRRLIVARDRRVAS